MKQFKRTSILCLLLFVSTIGISNSNRQQHISKNDMDVFNTLCRIYTKFPPTYEGKLELWKHCIKMGITNKNKN